MIDILPQSIFYQVDTQFCYLSDQTMRESVLRPLYTTAGERPIYAFPTTQTEALCGYHLPPYLL